MAKKDVAQQSQQQEGKEGNSGGHGFFLGFLLGAVVGGVAGVLLTPVPGEEARRRAAQEASALWERRDELANQARERAKEAATKIGDVAREQGLLGEEGEEAAPLERARSALSRIRSRFSEALEEGRDAAQEAEEETRAKFEEMTRPRDEASDV